jgi:cytochrome o ubiquinol oxidase operon protein cyoD
MMSLVFMLILVVITLSGSLWVMYHLKGNMMPVTVEQARQLP